MTKREVMNAIVNGTINEEVIAWAGHELEKMDSQNEKRRNAVSKKALENAPLIDKIVDEILGDEPKTASDVAGILEVSPQKASALLRAGVKDGRVKSEDVKVKGKGTQKGYTKA